MDIVHGCFGAGKELLILGSNDEVAEQKAPKNLHEKVFFPKEEKTIEQGRVSSIPVRAHKTAVVHAHFSIM